MFKPKINDFMPFVIIGGSGVAIYLIYKSVQGVKDVAGKAGDIIGKGPETEKAQATVDNIESLDPKDNPFSPKYIEGLTGNFHVLTGAAVTRLHKEITKLLSLGQTYLHPLSFEANRKKVVTMLKRDIKHKTQLSYLAKYFESRGDNLFNILNDGFRDTGVTTSSNYQRMFTDLVKHMLKLPA